MIADGCVAHNFKHFDDFDHAVDAAGGSCSAVAFLLGGDAHEVDNALFCDDLHGGRFHI